MVLSLMAFSGVNSFAQFPAASGYETLFNGYNLDGWQIQWPGNWTVKDRILTGRQEAETGGDSWLFTEREWDDFALELEFRITQAGNSGVGIRMPQGVEGRPSQHGYEIQINDSDEEFPTGSIFRHHAATMKNHQVGKWNQMAIIAVKNHFVVYLNRQKVLDVRMAGSKQGRIGLQVHGGEQYKDQVVEFRNIRIKDLKPQYQAESSPVKFKVHQIDTLNSEGVAVADINRDGKLDITCGPRWYEAPDWKVHEYRKVTTDPEFMSNYGEVAMDVNQDGWIDIISGGWFEPQMYWFENPGTHEDDVEWKRHLISDSMHSTEAIIPCDIDRDGRLDILPNRYSTDVPVTYFAYVGLEKSESGFEHRKIGDQGRGHGMGVGDVNGDGREDLTTPAAGTKHL